MLAIDSGTPIRARNVVVATGLYQAPKIPALSGKLPANIRQVHSDAYRNPQKLLPGAVLVVGSAQSGAQITEELYEAGKKVYLAVGRAGRTPRRYRGKDANWWSARLGLYGRTVGELPSPKAKFSSKPHISGVRGGHTLNLHQFARDGVVLLGHLTGVDNGVIKLAPDLHDNLAAADRFEADFVRAVDAYIAVTQMTTPEETLPALRDGFEQPLFSELDVKAAGITNVIWATGYRFDFSMIKLPVTDGDGYPIQIRGVTTYPGLYFVGLPWLSTAKSGLIYGVGEHAKYIAEKIAASHDSLDDAGDASLARIPSPEIAYTLQAASPAATGKRRPIAAAVVGISVSDRRVCDVRQAVAGCISTRRIPCQSRSLAEEDVFISVTFLERSRKMKQNLRMILMVITAAAVGVTQPLPRAANAESIQSVTAPSPPQVDFATISAGGLQLGMMAADVPQLPRWRYRRIELATRPGNRGEFHCKVCDHFLEPFDGSHEVALRPTVYPIGRFT